jgi:hypothetical protein
MMDLVLAEIDLNAVIGSHEYWISHFQDALDKNCIDKSPPEAVRLDYRCDLGKWLYGAGAEQFAK